MVCLLLLVVVCGASAFSFLTEFLRVCVGSITFRIENNLLCVAHFDWSKT